MEELTPQEIEAFKILSSKGVSSPEFERKLIEKLHHQNLIHQSKKRTVMKKTIINIAASIALLFGGYYLGTHNFGKTSTNITKQEYALFLYENEEFVVEDTQTLVQEYKSWAVNLGKEEKLAYAEKLKDAEDYWLGKTSVRNNTSKLTGYFVFYADSFEEAQKIAKTHPHVGYGGGLELRPIEKVN